MSLHRIGPASISYLTPVAPILVQWRDGARIAESVSRSFGSFVDGKRLARLLSQHVCREKAFAGYGGNGWRATGAATDSTRIAQGDRLRSDCSGPWVISLPDSWRAFGVQVDMRQFNVYSLHATNRSRWAARCGVRAVGGSLARLFTAWWDGAPQLWKSGETRMRQLEFRRERAYFRCVDTTVSVPVDRRLGGFAGTQPLIAAILEKA